MTELSYPVLGFDPAPGHAASVGALGATLRKVSNELGDAYRQLSHIGEDTGMWSGQAADAFRQRVGPLPQYLSTANRSLGEAGKILGQWSTELTSLQGTAHRYETEAAAVQKQLQRAQANPDLKLAGRHFPDQASLQQAEFKIQEANAEVDRVEHELEAIRQQARRLQHQHRELADQVAKRLKNEATEAVPPPGLLDWLSDALSDLGRSASDLAARSWEFIQQHAGDIKAVGDVLSTTSAVLGSVAIVTAPIEPVGAVFAAAAAVTGVGAMASHGLAKAAGANVSWSSIGGDALGLIPFGKGFAMGSKVATVANDATPLAKNLAAGVGHEAAQNLSKGFGSTLSTVEKQGKQIFDGVEAGGQKIIGPIGEDAKHMVLKGEGVANRMATGANESINTLRQGQWLGTKGLSQIGVDIDPMSGVGRSLDAGIKGGKAVGGYVYNQIEPSSPGQ